MIIPELRSQTLEGVLEEFAAMIASDSDFNSHEIKRVLLEREKLGSTGLESGIAIPHAKLKNLNNIIACFAKSTEGIDFNALDGGKSHLFFMLLAPEDSAGKHLKALARISRLTKDPNFRESLLNAGTKEEIFKIIKEEDSKN